MNLRDNERGRRGHGRIRVLLSTPNANIAARDALVKTRYATHGVGAHATTIQNIDDTTAPVLAQQGTLNSLGAVLQRIDVFVNVVDQMASVCASLAKCFLDTDCFTGSSLCQVGMAGFIFGIQGRRLVVNSAES